MWLRFTASHFEVLAQTKAIHFPFRDRAGAIKGIMMIVVDITPEVLARKKVEVTVAELEQERELREHFVAAFTRITPRC